MLQPFSQAHQGSRSLVFEDIHSNTLSLHKALEEAKESSLPLGVWWSPQQGIPPSTLPFNLPQHSLSGSDSNLFLYVSSTRTPKLLITKWFQDLLLGLMTILFLYEVILSVKVFSSNMLSLYKCFYEPNSIQTPNTILSLKSKSMKVK